ncbi:hypothetical protein ACTXT7_008407 [Hymenolepis weldensis]
MNAQLWVLKRILLSNKRMRDKFYGIFNLELPNWENPPPSYFAPTGGTQPPPNPDVISPNQPSRPPMPTTDNASAPPYPTPSTLPSTLPIGSGWRA